MFNVVLGFRRGFTHDGVYVSDPVFIAVHYTRGAFPTDAVASLPYAWLLGIQAGPIGEPSAGVRLLPLLRVVRLAVPLVRRLSTHEYVAAVGSRGLSPGARQVLRVISLLVYTCHWMGCLWWTVGELEQDHPSELLAGNNSSLNTSPDPLGGVPWGPSSWLRKTQPINNQYAHALLWGAGMMTGFVPKDVTPHTFPEVVVTVLALFFGLIVNTAIISSTTSALQSMSFKSARVEHKLQNILQYMRHKRVPAPLARSILGFYEYQLSPYRSGSGQNDVSDLPPILSMELIIHTHQNLFRECPIFRLVPPPTALCLVEHFESVVFVPEEVVIHEGKTNHALYVINRGLVKVWRQDKAFTCGSKLLTTLTDSDFFGEQTLLKTITETAAGQPASACKANATCQCASYCDMFRLSVRPVRGSNCVASVRAPSSVVHALHIIHGRRGLGHIRTAIEPCLSSPMISSAYWRRLARVENLAGRARIWQAS